MISRAYSRLNALALGVAALVLAATALAMLAPGSAAVSAARVAPEGVDARPQAPERAMLASATEVITYRQNFPTFLVFGVEATIDCDDTAVPGEDPGAFTCTYTVENVSENEISGTSIEFEDRIQLAVDIQGADYAIADARDFVGDWQHNGTIFSTRPLAPDEVASFTVDFYFPSDAAVESNGPLAATVLVTSDGTDDNEGLLGDLDVPFTFTPQALVELDKIVLNDEASAGAFVLFELTASNDGPSDVRGASITDLLAGQLTGQAIVAPDQLTDFDLAANDIATFVISAQLPDTAPPNSTFGNTATLTAPGVTLDGASVTTAMVDGTVGFAFLPPTDMSIVKSIAPPGTITPGEDVTFFLDVTNNGPQIAQNVVVSDQLYDIPSFPGASCTGPNDDWTSGGTIVRRLRGMPIGATERITCIYSVPPDAHQVASGTPVNVAFVAASNPEPDAPAAARANNSVSVPVPLQAESTVGIDKTLLNNPVPPDGTAFFEIAVCNDGPSDVAGLRVIDTPGTNLDAPTLILSPDVSAPGSLYVPAGQCRDAIATARVSDPAPPGASFSNLAAIDTSAVPANRGPGSTLDPIIVLSPPEAAATGEVGQFLPPVDLELTKLPSAVVAGASGEAVVLQLTNPVDSTLAEGVIISELFPFEAVIESVSGPYVVDQGGTLVRTAPMPPDTVDDIVIVFSVHPDTLEGPETNTAVATSDNPESDPADNIAQAPIQVSRVVDLSIDKSDLVDPVRAGEVATYLIRITNNGPSSVSSGEIVVIDTLRPAGFGIEYAGGSPECLDTLPICTIPPAGGRIEPGETYDLELAFRLPDDFDPANGPLMDTASASWRGQPPVEATEETDVVPGSRADLHLIKFVKPDEQVAAGETFTYSLFVDNLGPQTAFDLVLEDTMVSSGSYDVLSIVSDSGGTCNPTSGSSSGVNNSFVFSCTLASLPIFERWTVTVVAQADEAQDVNNTARVFMDDDLRPGIPVPVDPNPDNNYVERALNVAGTADLSVTKAAVGRVRDAGCQVPPTASDAPDRVSAGLDLTYTMAVTNDGPSEAVAAELWDRLPPGIVVTGFTVTDAAGAPAGSCTTGAAGSAIDPMICSLGTLAAGETVTVVVEADVMADVPDQTILENDVRVTSDTFDDDESNNRATNLSTVVAQSDLAIAKDDTPDAVIAGEGLTYRLSLVNFGPSVATDVVISDQLHPDLTFVGYQLINGSGVCNVDTLNLVTCQVDPVAPNGPPGLPVVVELFLTVNPDAAAGLLPNFASVNSASNDLCVDNDLAFEQTVVSQSADLAVFKRARNVAPIAGEQVTFEVVVRNNGPSDAQGVVVTDTVPAGLVFLDQNDNCALAAGVITCEVPVAAPGNILGAGQSTSLDLLFDVVPNVAQGAVITNTAIVSSATPDTMLVNNSNDSVIFVRTVADLRLRKIGKPDGAVRAGDLLTYTIFTDNLGPSWAHGTFVTDEILSDGLFDVVSIDPDVNGNRPTAVCTLTSANDGALNVAVPNAGAGSAGAPLASDVNQRATVSCQLPDTPDPTPPFSADDLEVFGGPFGGPNAGRWVAEIVVRATEMASINDVASASSLDIDPDASNNEAAVEHEVVDIADLAVVKTAVGQVRDLGCAVPPTASPVPDRVTAGLGVTYTITVSNSGPSLAENASLVDRLPPGIVVNGYQVLDGVGAPAGTCTTGTPGSAADPMVCDLGSLAVGEQRTVIVTADVGAGVADGTLLENDVSVSSNTFDDMNANNRDTNLTRVGAAADLSIEKEGDPAAVLAGEGVTYRIAVRNLGPSVAPNVVVRDALDSNLTFLGSQIIGGSGSCAVDTGNVVTCQLGNVTPNPAPALPVVVELFLQVNTDAPAGVIVNTATVASDVTDPCGANNSDDATTDVTQGADLAVLKATDDLTPVAGGEVTFSIDVVNNGPSDAQGVTVTDTVPAGLIYRNQNDFCSLLGTLITCEVPLPAPDNTLEVGQRYAFDLVFDVLPDVAPDAIITNTATVQAITPDAFLANNQDDSTVFIRTEADLRVRKFGKPDAQVRADELLTYTIIVDNLGPSWAHGTTVTDEIVSSGLFDVIAVDPDVNGNRPTAVCTLTSANDGGLNVAIPNAGAGSPAVPVAADVDERGTLTCTLPDTPDPVPPFSIDDLETFGGPFGGPNAGRWIVEIVLRAAEAQSINDVASVSSDDTDVDASNNEAFVEHDITDVADLAVEKTAVGRVRDLGCAVPATASDVPDRVTAGLDVTYSITVTNGGPSTAENVLLIDRLPPGIVVTGYSVVDLSGAPSGNCDTGTPGEPLDKLTCGLGTLREGEGRVVTIDADVGADVRDGTILENDVLVTSDVFDIDNRNNFDSNLTLVDAQADLAIDKDDEPDAVVAGEELTYRLTVTNAGPSFAPNVVVRDQLNPNLTFLGFQVIGGPGVCNVDTGNLVTCQLGTVAPNPPPALPVVVELFLLVNPDAPAVPIANTATVTSGVADPCLVNNSDDDTTEVGQNADLALLKSVDDLTPVAGGEVTFAIDVVNNGPSDAQSVTVTDPVPAGLVFRNQNDFCTLAGNLITCEIPLAAPNNTLEVGQSYGFDLVFDVLPDVTPGAIITNTATVQSATADLFTANNSDDSTIYVRTEADLRVRKFGKPDGAVRAGELLTYTIIVDNLGPSFSHATYMTDEIVASELFDVVAVDPDVNGNRPTAVCTLTSANDGALNVAIPNGGAGMPGAPIAVDVDERATLTCVLPDTPDPAGNPPFSIDDLETFGGPLQGANAGRWIIEVVVTARQTSSINNVASVSSDDVDPDQSNNEAFVQHAITDVADLAIEKTAVGEIVQPGCPPVIALVPDAVTAGLGATYTITVTNNGPSDAENVVVVDRLPPGVVVTGYQVVDATGAPSGNCDTGTAGSAIDKLTCGLGLLRPGEQEFVTVEIDVDADVLAGTILENDVLVFSDIFDIDNTNNYDTNLMTVGASADLEILKDDDPDTVIAGEELEYTFTLRNLGPSFARNVRISDQLHPDLIFLGATITGAGGTCSVDITNLLTCAIGTIAPNPSPLLPVVVEVRMLVDEDTLVTSIDNTVSVTSDTTDPCADNNTAVENTIVGQNADLRLLKTVSDLTPVAGEEVRFHIDVRNFGPSDAQNVIVTDAVPDGLLFRNQNDFCTETAGLITCEIPLAAPNNVLVDGAGYAFDLVFDVDSDVAPGAIIVNTATVSSTTPDPFTANNTDDSTIYVRTVADLRVRKFGKPDSAVRAGELLTYTIIVDNLGPSFSHATYVTDEIVASELFDVVAVDPDVNGNRPTAVCTLTSANDAGLNIGIPNGGAGAPGAHIANDIDERATLTCVIPDAPDVPGTPPYPRSTDDLETFGGPLQGPNAGRWIVEVVVTADQTSNINDVASVASADTDPDLANNEAFVEHDITDVADLRVMKTALGQNHIGCDNEMIALPDSVTAGGVISYTIMVQNFGPSDAENVLIFDRLPPGLVVTDYSLVDEMGAPKGDCETGTPGEPSDRLTCGVGTLLSEDAAGVPGEKATLIVTATVDTALLDGTILENDVFVDSDIFDIDNSNNHTSNLTTVNTRADLAIVKTNKGPNPVPAGESLVYQIDVMNLGKSVARGVVVSDTLPAGLFFETALGATCYEVPGMPQMVECQLGDMAVGETRTFFLSIGTEPDTVPSPDMMITLVNTAEVDSRTIDPCPDNNIATADTPVVRESDVYVFKTDLVDPVIAGEEAAYRIRFGNNGPSDAVLVSLTDTLPVGFTYNRCAPLDPNDSVECMVISGDGVITSQVVRLESLSMTNYARFVDGGDLAAGAELTFDLIADVASGYVLDGRGDTAPGEGARAFGEATGYPHYANNLVMITSSKDPAPFVPYPFGGASPDSRIAGPGFPDVAASSGAQPTGLFQGGEPPIERNNWDNEITRVNALADLAIHKTDIFGDPALAPDNWFLMCDPVQPGGMITYTLSITNTGPSDAAEVIVEDWLDELYVVHDPVRIDVEIVNDEGLVEEIRDTGYIEVVAGRDRNFLNQRELGRINAGNNVVILIRVMVRQDAPCGSEALNTARVSTRANDIVWPPVNGLPLGRTPTADPDLSNNTDIELTAIECASLSVNKTISQDGTCPGKENANLIPGAQVTFCYEITNTGTTYLDNIMVSDVLQTRSEPWGTEIFTATITDVGDPKIPVPPGATFVLSTTVTKLDCECGDNTNVVTVKADAVNAGRTLLPCIDVEPVSDSATLFVACGGADTRLQLPILGPEECEPLLAIQNLGDEIARGMLVVWGDPGACPPQASGPLKIECTGLIVPGSSWYYPASLLPQGARSGILYSLNTTNDVDTPRGGEKSFDKLACESLFDLVVGNASEWEYFDENYRAGGTYLGPKDINGNQVVLDFEANQGEPLAVVVDRTCPDPTDQGRSVSAAYIGISTDYEGALNPIDGGYALHAPLLFANRADLNSLIHIHNSGTYCSSLELWMSDTDNCLRPVLGDVLALAPGETVTFDPNTVVGPDWLGSAFIRASQPLGVVVDTFGPSLFTSYRGVPADIDLIEFTVGSFINYAPLTYSEYQGWDSAITVQNLSGVHAAKVKVYFLDRSGGIINTLVDWICPRGNQTFFLPLIDSIPGNWVGSARVESQEWFAWGSNLVEAPRIQSVVTLDKWIDPQRSERIEAVAYNALTEKLAFDWQIGTNKGGLTDGSAVIGLPILAKGNRGITSEIAITNLVPKPGFTDFAIYLYDQNGLVDFYCQKLGEKQVEYIDLSQQGAIRDGYLGSAVISATFWEHHVWDNRGNHQRNLVGLSAIVVERIGGTLLGPDVPGDESKAYEGIPIFTRFVPQRDVLCPGLPGPR